MDVFFFIRYEEEEQDFVMSNNKLLYTNKVPPRHTDSNYSSYTINIFSTLLLGAVNIILFFESSSV